MALSPIEMFKSNESSLAQILQGGSRTVSDIMSSAIQLGRDMANNQQRQESDLISMRQNETNLAQRRAENLTKGIADTQNFARRAFETDRKFGADQQQQGFENQRMEVNDMFARNASDRNYGLSVAAGARAERQLTDQELARKQEQARLDAERANIERMLGGDTAPIEAAGLPAPLTKAESDVSYGQIADQRQAEGYPEATRETPVENLFPTVEPTKPALDPQKAASARAIIADPKASAATKRIAAGVLGLTGNGLDGEKPPTARQQAMDARTAKKDAEADAKSAAAAIEKEMKTMVEGDLSTFIPKGVVDATDYKDLKGEDGKPLPVPADREAKSAAWDKDRFVSEVQAAKNQPTADAYANLILNQKPTAAQLEKRRQLWYYANGQDPQASPSTTGARKFNPKTGRIE